MSDILLNSPILRDSQPSGEDGGDGAGGSGGAYEFGFDPSLDPELAMVCLISYPLYTCFDMRQGVTNVSRRGKCPSTAK